MDLLIHLTFFIPHFFFTSLILFFLHFLSADADFDPTFQTNVVVRNNGSIKYTSPGIFRSICQIKNVKNYPLDEHNCTLTFGSWTYDGEKVN